MALRSPEGHRLQRGLRTGALLVFTLPAVLAPGSADSSVARPAVSSSTRPTSEQAARPQVVRIGSTVHPTREDLALRSHTGRQAVFQGDGGVTITEIDTTKGVRVIFKHGSEPPQTARVRLGQEALITDGSRFFVAPYGEIPFEPTKKGPVRPA